MTDEKMADDTMEHGDRPTVREYIESRLNEQGPRVAVNEVFKPELVEVYLPRMVPTILALPPGFTSVSTEKAIADHERAQATPFRRKGTYYAADIPSLLLWMNRQCTDRAPVFAQGAEKLASDWADPHLSLIGIGNYSENAEEPAWHDLTVQYDFPVTKAWQEWAKFSSVTLSQGQFADFVEAHLYEFDLPKTKEVLTEAATRTIEALGGNRSVASPSKMYELAHGIRITVKEDVEVALDRATGEATLKFSETHTGTGGRPVQIPKFFWIRVPIFFGEPESLAGALLRYRNAGGGKVVWSYELFAPDLVVKAAFDKAVAFVNQARTVYLGTPDRP